VRRLRLGAVSYLNAEPLIHGLRDESRFELVSDVPARVAEMLRAGEVDVGMIPSIEYALGEYAIVPGVAIGSRGAVRSVVLLHERPLESLRSVALDTSSRTSVALVRILLRERLGRDPEYVEMAPDARAMLRRADAALLIGDPALYFDGPARRVDLGQAWYDATRLPFVFAFWAARPDALGDADVARLQQALAAGLRHVPQIASSYNGHGAGHAAENEAYLRDNIVFRFGEQEQAGLREFFRRAHDQGLIPRRPELRFHGAR
jgi:chorismate dehydratase